MLEDATNFCLKMLFIACAPTYIIHTCTTEHTAHLLDACIVVSYNRYAYTCIGGRRGYNLYYSYLCIRVFGFICSNTDAKYSRPKRSIKQGRDNLAHNSDLDMTKITGIVGSPLRAPQIPFGTSNYRGSRSLTPNRFEVAAEIPITSM